MASLPWVRCPWRHIRAASAYANISRILRRSAGLRHRFAAPIWIRVLLRRSLPLEAPMTVPLQITFRDLPSSSAVEAQIRERAEHLEHVFDRLTSCRVIVEGRHRPQRAGRVAHLCIELTLPGKIITIGRGGATAYEAHDDVFVAVRA